MNEQDMNEWLTKEQNSLDHLTRKIYGRGVRFEHLSAFAQNTIEKLAREKALISDPDPELRSVMANNMDLRRELDSLSERLAVALREVQDLWDENERLKMERSESEDSNSWSALDGEGGFSSLPDRDTQRLF